MKLADYTRQFTATHGRPIQSADDIAPVKEEWARYKFLKFTLSEQGQATGIDRALTERISGKSAAAGAKGHRKSASLSSMPVGATTVSSAFSLPLSRAQSAVQPRSPPSPHSPPTPSTLPTQPNTPSTPLTPSMLSAPSTPVSGSHHSFATLYSSMPPHYTQPSLLTSLPSPCSSPLHSSTYPVLPPSPTSPYSPANSSYATTPSSPCSPMTGSGSSCSGLMSVGGIFGPYYHQPLAYGSTPVMQLPYPHGVMQLPMYRAPASPVWC